MSDQTHSALGKIKISKVIWPTIIGLGVVIFMIFREFDPQAFNQVEFNINVVWWLLFAALLMIFRDFGFILRIKILTQNRLTWAQAIRVIFLWEFTSAITPSAIGGTSVAILYVHKEGIKLGQSSAVVMATSFLDELYFVIFFPLLLAIINIPDLFTIGQASGFSWALLLPAVIGYAIKFGWVLLISYGLFVNPRGFKWLLLFVFKLPLIRRWRAKANEVGDDIIVSSKVLKSQKFGFWLKAFGATVFSWTSRYWVINAMFVAFFTVHDHFLLFARQLVAWIMMLVTPTPGGAGFAEFIFTEYFHDFIPIVGITGMMALLWRFFTYYPYLVIGVFLFPRWIKLKFKKRNTND